MLYAVFGFVLLQLLVGVLASRGIRNEDDFLLAGRRVGPILATASIFATWFGAESCLSAAGDAYSGGITALSTEPMAYGLCLVLMGLLFAAPLWRLRITTLPDFFGRRFGRAPERLAAVLLVPSSVLWAAAQIRAFGHIVAEHSNGAIDLSTAIGIASAVAVVYTMSGGLLADIYTDLVQGIALLVGLVVLAVAVFSQAPPATDPEPLLAIGADAAGAPWTWLKLLETWSVPICGSILAQEALSRSFAARSASVARNAAIAGGVLYVLVGLVPLALGAIAPRLVPGLKEPESVLLRLSADYLPPVLSFLFLGALISAILSTVDSCILVASSVLTRNVLPGQRRDGTGSAWPARIACATVGVVGFALAVTGDTVHDLVEEASGFGSAGVFVLGVVGVFTPFGGAAAACGALGGGLVAWVVARHVLEGHIDHPYLCSLAAAGAGLVLGAAWAKVRGHSNVSSGTA